MGQRRDAVDDKPYDSEGARALIFSSCEKRKLMFGQNRASHSARSTLLRARSAQTSARCSGAPQPTFVTSTSNTVEASTHTATMAFST